METGAYAMRRCMFLALGTVFLAVCGWTAPAVSSPETIPWIQPEDGLPEIPLEYPGGSRLLFPRSNGSRTFPYSGGEVITLLSYPSGEDARKDMEAFAEGHQRLADVENGAAGTGLLVFAADRDGISGWFLLGNFIVGVRVPSGAEARAAILCVARVMAERHRERLDLMFGTPERCLRTYLDALDRGNIPVVAECVFSEGQERERVVMASRILLNPFSILRGRTPGARVVEYGAAEHLSETQAVIAIGSQYRDTPALEVLRILADSGWGTGEKVWVPFRKAGGLWGIDLAAVRELRFSRVKPDPVRDVCRGNLRTLWLACRMYAADFPEMPADPSALVPRYVSNPQLLICPGDKEAPAPGRGRKGVSSSYVFGPSPSLLGKEGVAPGIVLHDRSPEYHGGQGRNVVWSDGTVEFLPEDRFRQVLEQQAGVRPEGEKAP